MTDDEFTNDRRARADDTQTSGTASELQLMSDLDEYQVADDSPDVDGWTVRTSDGQHVGKVHDLVVSVSEMRVRFLDIDIGHDQHAMLPVQDAQLDDDDEYVIIRSMSVLQQDVPGLRRSAGGNTRVGRDSNLSNSNVLVTDVATDVATDAATGSGAMSGDEEIRMPVMREEAVVEKRPVVREEIVIRRRLVMDERSVDADLRRERIDVQGADDSVQHPRSNI
ncbi:MAG TPA: DUF2382 domain-containing protein [Gemmatimonas sp.]|nr:DUF2382 domain-containing protein [Gemmatimonas sp.]